MKKVFYGLGALLLVLLAASCATGPVTVFDPDIPDDESTTLCFVRSLSGGQGRALWVDSFNGIPMQDKRIYGLKLPAGQTALTGKAIVFLGNTTFEIEGVEFAYTFEAGKEYFIDPYITVIDKEYAFFIRVYEVELEYDAKKPGKISDVKNWDTLFDGEPAAKIKVEITKK